MVLGRPGRDPSERRRVLALDHRPRVRALGFSAEARQDADQHVVRGRRDGRRGRGGRMRRPFGEVRLVTAVDRVEGVVDGQLRHGDRPADDDGVLAAGGGDRKGRLVPVEDFAVGSDCGHRQ